MFEKLVVITIKYYAAYFYDYMPFQGWKVKFGGNSMDTAVYQLRTFNMMACIVTPMVHLKKNHITADESNIPVQI